MHRELSRSKTLFLQWIRDTLHYMLTKKFKYARLFQSNVNWKNKLLEIVRPAKIALLERLRQSNYEFEASLTCLVRPSLKMKRGRNRGGGGGGERG